MRKESKNMKSILNNFRTCFTTILFISLILVIERLVFDFLGFMFGMIIVDVLHIIFIIIGLFGSYQYRVNYVATCIIWSLLWIAWNTFVICNYLNLGILNRYDPFVLNLSTGGKSFWLSKSIGCSTTIISQNETTWSIQPHVTTQFESLQNIDSLIARYCIMPFYWIEIIHSSALIFFSTLVVIFGLLLANAFNDEDDTFDYIGGFDAPPIMPNFLNDQQFIQSNNAHIRLEPLYAENQNGHNHNQVNIFDAQTLRIK